MSNTSLQSALHDLASNFADAVLTAVRSASLQELLAGSSAVEPRRSPGRPRGSAATKSAPTTARASAPVRKPAGRLRRRTPEEIAKSLAQVVALVKTKDTGLRSEEIQKALKLDKREVPRILHEGLRGKKLKKKGEKRATVYSAA